MMPSAIRAGRPTARRSRPHSPDARLIVHLHGVDFHDYIPPEAPTLATLHLPLDWYPGWIFDPHSNLWLHCVSEAQHAARPAGARLLDPIPNGVSPRLLETRVRKRDHAMVLCRICPERGIHLALEACHAPTWIS